VSPNTRSACAEVLYLDEPEVPNAHSVAVIVWPPFLMEFLRQSGSPLLEKVASELPADGMANRGIRETTAWDSAVSYCQSIGR